MLKLFVNDVQLMSVLFVSFHPEMMNKALIFHSNQLRSIVDIERTSVLIGKLLNTYLSHILL